jgi:lipopolysaccharide transport system permease protein
MLLFFIFLFFSGYAFHTGIMLVPFIYYLQQLFAFGFGLLAATMTVFIRDLREVVGIFLQLWFWFTPIVYVSDILPDTIKKIIVYNPAYIIIDAYRCIFVYNEAPAFVSLIVLTVITHIIILIAYMAFRSLEKDVRDFL